MPFYFRKECPLNSGYLTPATGQFGMYGFDNFKGGINDIQLL
ncbi:hypothetical protein SFK304_2678 [Shigella flexneri K-304]|nr:hypothetical protein SFK304_2678 [Shigella flexneri K-304]